MRVVGARNRLALAGAVLNEKLDGRGAGRREEGAASTAPATTTAADGILLCIAAAGSARARDETLAVRACALIMKWRPSNRAGLSGLVMEPCGGRARAPIVP